MRDPTGPTEPVRRVSVGAAARSGKDNGAYGTAVSSIVEENANRPICVPARFAHEVLTFLLLVYCAESWRGAPQIFTAVGPPGSGKTVTLREICQRFGAVLEIVDASMCEDEMAGKTVDKLQALYIKASEDQVRSGIPRVIFWNEVALGIGNRDRRIYITVNTQLLVSAIMEITDQPTRVRGRDTVLVPFIMTSNDMSPLYAPLRRFGRMRVVRWELTPEETHTIGRHILRGYLAAEQFDWLAARAGSWTPAHYQELKTAILRLRVRQAVEGLSAREALLAAVQGKGARLIDAQGVAWETLKAAVADVERGVEAARTDYTIQTKGGKS
ncbi:MAG TPA: AAA family ATPase [Phycisphaerae bacterium]|nr:AAA family ATPase [Phycisphaerae bacterium]HRY71471.1 AAA family ATPase [Phycisphaerae bacterium]